MLSLYTSQAFKQVQIYIFLNSFGASIKYFTAGCKIEKQKIKRKREKDLNKRKSVRGLPEKASGRLLPHCSDRAGRSPLALPRPADRKSTRLNSSHSGESRMPSSA